MSAVRGDETNPKETLVIPEKPKNSSLQRAILNKTSTSKQYVKAPNKQDKCQRNPISKQRRINMKTGHIIKTSDTNPETSNYKEKADDEVETQTQETTQHNHPTTNNQQLNLNTDTLDKEVKNWRRALENNKTRNSEPPTTQIKEYEGDLPGVMITAVDLKFRKVYGDHIHQNDGSHLDGGIEGDLIWQQWFNEIASLPSRRYQLPRGRVGKTFIGILTKEWKGVLERKWNSERPLIFQAVILQRSLDIHGAGEIRKKTR